MTFDDYLKELNRIYRENPDRLVESGWTDTYWDGSFGPMHKYEVWDHPAIKLVDELRKKFYRASNRKNALQRAIFDSEED